MKYLTLDIETGGAESPDTTLLSSAFLVFEDGTEIDSLILYTGPDKGQPYKVHPKGMEVNSIDLIKHDKVAITYSEAGGRLFQFLKKHSNDGADRLTVVGFGIHSDMEKLYSCLLNKNTFNKFVDYLKIDVSSIVKFLKDAKLLVPEFLESVEGAAKFLNIPHIPHDPASDARATFLIYETLKGVLQLSDDYENWQDELGY